MSPTQWYQNKNQGVPFCQIMYKNDNRTFLYHSKKMDVERKAFIKVCVRRERIQRRFIKHWSMLTTTKRHC